jgi:hypothetical protein
VLAPLLILVAAQDNVELAALKKVDQTDRAFVSSPAEIDWERVSVRDAARQNRVRELLMADQVRTAHDFDNAALIMQHGSKPSDYLLAHELASIAAYMGKFGSLAALAEDRWLVSIGRTQRWGSQFDWDGNVKEIATSQAPVTEQMRRDLLLPTLAEIRQSGMQATMANLDERIAYLERRLDKSRWKPSKELAGRPGETQALIAVRKGQLNTPEDYVIAANALLSSKEPDVLLLAHELSVIAMARRSPRALRLFTVSLDRYLAVIGLPPRYRRGQIAPGVARELQVPNP